MRKRKNDLLFCFVCVILDMKGTLQTYVQYSDVSAGYYFKPKIKTTEQNTHLEIKLTKE